MIYLPYEITKHQLKTKNGDIYYAYQDMNHNPSLVLPCSPTAPDVLERGFHEDYTIGLTKTGKPRINAIKDNNIFYYDEYGALNDILSDEQKKEFDVKQYLNSPCRNLYFYNLAGKECYLPQKGQIFSDINGAPKIYTKNEIVDYFLSNDNKTLTYQIESDHFNLLLRDNSILYKIGYRDLISNPSFANLIKTSQDAKNFLIGISDSSYIENYKELTSLLNKNDAFELIKDYAKNLDVHYAHAKEMGNVVKYIFDTNDFSDIPMDEIYRNLKMYYHQIEGFALENNENTKNLFKQENLLKFFKENLGGYNFELCFKMGLDIKGLLKTEEGKVIVQESLKNCRYEQWYLSPQYGQTSMHSSVAFDMLNEIYGDFTEEEKILLMAESQEEFLSSIVPKDALFTLSDKAKEKVLSLCPSFISHITITELNKEDIENRISTGIGIEPVFKLPALDDEYQLKLFEKYSRLNGAQNFFNFETNFKYCDALKEVCLEKTLIYKNQDNRGVDISDKFIPTFQLDGSESADFLSRYLNKLETQVPRSSYKTLFDIQGSFKDLYKVFSDRPECLLVLFDKGLVSADDIPKENFTAEFVEKNIQYINEENYKRCISDSPNYKPTASTAIVLCENKDWYHEICPSIEYKDALENVNKNIGFLSHHYEFSTPDMLKAIVNSPISKLSYNNFTNLYPDFREAYLKNPAHIVVCNSKEEKDDVELMVDKVPKDFSSYHREGGSNIHIPYVIKADGTLRSPDDFEYKNPNKRSGDGTGTWNQIERDEVCFVIQKPVMKAPAFIEIKYVPNILTPEQESAIEEISQKSISTYGEFSQNDEISNEIWDKTLRSEKGENVDCSYEPANILDEIKQEIEAKNFAVLFQKQNAPSTIDEQLANLKDNTPMICNNNQIIIEPKNIEHIAEQNGEEH